MGEKIRSAWWSMEVPAGFSVEHDPECVTVSSPSFEGVLQLSAARKGTGAVDDSDLLEFAEDDMEEAGLPEGVTLPHFHGITLATQDQELFFRKWWLASGNLLVFATYTSSVPLRPSEIEQVEELLATLRPRAAEG